MTQKLEPKLPSPKHKIMAGDRALDFVLPAPDRKFYQFYEKTRGNPSVLLFYPSEQLKAQHEVEVFAELYREFHEAKIDIFAVTTSAFEQGKECRLPFMVWVDLKRKISEHYLTGAGIAPADRKRLTAFLLDQNQRVVSIISGTKKGKANLALQLLKKQAPDRNGHTLATTAPALIVPNLINQKMCTRLINMWKQGDKEEGQVISVVDDREINRVHTGLKKRRDHRITHKEVKKTLQMTIGRRIAPELNKAFNFRDFRFDRFLVGCYEAERGDYFRPHRGTLAPSTEDRVFALTLNLNASQYEGGELVFPEYGSHKYKPGNGCGILFSCSLLHEALPVTKGHRFALFTFLRQLRTPIGSDT